jgi:hypothetical protein
MFYNATSNTVTETNDIPEKPNILKKPMGAKYHNGHVEGFLFCDTDLGKFCKYSSLHMPLG